MELHPWLTSPDFSRKPQEEKEDDAASDPRRKLLRNQTAVQACLVSNQSVNSNTANSRTSCQGSVSILMEICQLSETHYLFILLFFQAPKNTTPSWFQPVATISRVVRCLSRDPERRDSCHQSPTPPKRFRRSKFDCGGYGSVPDLRILYIRLTIYILYIYIIRLTIKLYLFIFAKVHQNVSNEKRKLKKQILILHSLMETSKLTDQLFAFLFWNSSCCGLIQTGHTFMKVKENTSFNFEDCAHLISKVKM